MDGIDLVVSALGITRQADGLGYRDVDFQANMNLLIEAETAGVGRFAYIHVLNADAMAGVPLVDAKTAFVDALHASYMPATVIAPTGYFSDMGDILAMAQRGRVWLFGDGTQRLNPIHGADLAVAIADATDAGRGWAEIGGPDVMTQNEIANAAFAALGTAPRITHLPDVLRRTALAILPLLPRRVSGPARFFLTALGIDMVAPRFGTRHLGAYFKTLAPMRQAHPKDPAHDPSHSRRPRGPDLRRDLSLGFALLVTVLAPLGFGTDQIDAAAVAGFIAERPGVLIAWNSLIYIVNALALAVLVVALRQQIAKRGRTPPRLPGRSG